MIASRFTSRFKRSGESAEAPSTPEAATLDSGPAPAAAEAPAEVKAGDAVKVDAAAAQPKSDMTASDTAAPSGPAPAAARPRASRLVEAVRAKPFAGKFDRDALARSLQAAKPAAIPAAVAAAIVLSLGLGYGLGLTRVGDGSARWMDATATEIRQANQELARFASEQKALKASVDGLKGERERSRGEILSRQAQLADKVEKAGQDHNARIGRLAELVDRLEKTQRDPARLQVLTERLDRIEKGLASGATASAPTPPPKPVTSLKEAPAPDVAQTGSIGEPKAAAKPEPDPRKTQVEGYFVRDFDNGYALVETRAGRYLDVAVGYTVPGVGRVEAIERRGRQWVVVTNKGYIGER